MDEWERCEVGPLLGRCRWQVNFYLDACDANFEQNFVMEHGCCDDLKFE